MKSGLHLTLVGVLAITGCATSDEDGGIPAISVTVRPGGQQCVIGTQTMACTEVAAYIRDIAKIESDKRIEVTGDIRTADHRHFSAVIKSIKAEGYTFVYGAFDVGAGAKQ